MTNYMGKMVRLPSPLFLDPGRLPLPLFLETLGSFDCCTGRLRFLRIIMGDLHVIIKHEKFSATFFLTISFHYCEIIRAVRLTGLNFK